MPSVARTRNSWLPPAGAAPVGGPENPSYTEKELCFTVAAVHDFALIGANLDSGDAPAAGECNPSGL